jgi:hypothetical protein
MPRGIPTLNVEQKEPYWNGSKKKKNECRIWPMNPVVETNCRKTDGGRNPAFSLIIGQIVLISLKENLQWQDHCVPHFTGIYLRPEK